MNILTVNLLFSTLVFWIAARLYILPRLDDLKPNIILLPILLLHSLRHLGLMFLAPSSSKIRRSSPMPTCIRLAGGIALVGCSRPNGYSNMPGRRSRRTGSTRHTGCGAIWRTAGGVLDGGARHRGKTSGEWARSLLA